MKKTGVQHRLTRVYLVQLLLISLATVLGVWATANIIEHVLVKQALIKGNRPLLVAGGGKPDPAASQHPPFVGPAEQ